MRAVRPAAMALFFLVVLMALVLVSGAAAIVGLMRGRL
jgi:hypothetical protein